MLKHLIYVSTASYPMEDRDLVELLDVSRRNNQEEQLTGMLLYKDGTFMQVLEGEPAMLKKRYNVISRDSRHEDLMLLSDRSIETRSFGDWSMGFHHLQPLDDDILEGFSPFLKQGFHSQAFSDSPDMAHRLLMAFRDYS